MGTLSQATEAIAKICELKQTIVDITNALKAYEPVILEYIKNTDIPLEDRWSIYSVVPQGILVCSWVQHLNFAGEEISWYDDHYIERHQSVDNVEIIEHYEENKDCSYFNKDGKITDEAISQLKEDMLQSGVRYWRNDW